MNTLIRWLCRGVRTYRDVRAVARGRFGARLYNRAVGRLANRGLRRLWR